MDDDTYSFTSISRASSHLGLDKLYHREHGHPFSESKYRATAQPMASTSNKPMAIGTRDSGLGRQTAKHGEAFYIPLNDPDIRCPIIPTPTFKYTKRDRDEESLNILERENLLLQELQELREKWQRDRVHVNTETWRGEVQGPPAAVATPYIPRHSLGIDPDIRNHNHDEGAMLQEIEDLRRRLRLREMADLETRNPTVNLHSPTAKHRKEIKPSKYDGQTPCEDYMVHFDMVARANGWTYEEMGVQLSAHLSYPATSVLSSLDAMSRQDYNAVATELFSLYRAGKSAEISRAELRGRHRQAGEHLSSLAHDIKRKARQAYPTAMPDIQNTIATDQFIKALGEGKEIAWHVHQSKPTSIDEAVAAALDWEAWRDVSPDTPKKVRAIERKMETAEENSSNSSAAGILDVSTLETVMKQLVSGVTEVLDKKLTQLTTNNTAPVRRPWKGRDSQNIECYGCHEKGHIRRHCPKNNQQQSNSNPHYNHQKHQGNF